MDKPLESLDCRPGSVMWVPKVTPSLCLDFPMRPDFLAQVIVPRDLTEKEAKRLCAFVETLPIPEQPVSAKDGQT